jgi:ADP-ribose pyrophosphatase YjhB (NUDIX family)
MKNNNDSQDNQANPSSLKWLEWAREIEALGQTGVHYAQNEYDRQRYHRLVEIAAEIVSEYSDIDFIRVNNLYQSQTGYATPRIDVRGAVFRNERILMVRERLDGGWTLPGGWVDVGDIPSGGAEREVWEETGYEVKATRVIGVYDANRSGPLELFHAFKIVFLCELLGGKATTSYETSEVRFFARNEIPLVLSGERTWTRHIDDAYACLDHPEGLTVFD